MVASVLNTPQAIQVSVFVVRAFVKLRRMISENRELARKIAPFSYNAQNEFFYHGL
jgi:hypothetical protein